MFKEYDYTDAKIKLKGLCPEWTTRALATSLMKQHTGTISFPPSNPHTPPHTHTHTHTHATEVGHWVMTMGLYMSLKYVPKALV